MDKMFYHITEIHAEMNWYAYGIDMVEVTLSWMCYGITGKNTYQFPQQEWQKAKMDGGFYDY